jgi:hypothetical protein
MGAWMRALGVFAMPRQRADLFAGVVLERPAKRLFGKGNWFAFTIVEILRYQ